MSTLFLCNFSSAQSKTWSAGKDTVIILRDSLGAAGHSKVYKDSLAVMGYTAVTEPCAYMTTAEREVIQYLNMARMYPKWFLYFFLPKPRTENEKSLYKTMSEMKTIPDPLKPNKKCWESAKCHAITSGLKSYTGHERQSKDCKKYYHGECCNYGVSDPAQMVLDLLIDEGVPSLGHRWICLHDGYKSVGVSIQPHKGYGTNVVLDFDY
ncbi:MAG: hypothetical protein JNJ58_06050 [Chitinophagaceae bacterium]|nr:hypothetical protein [Chitinophagaceae bacterium]